MLTNSLRGPHGEGIRVEELDVVAAWCSGVEEDDARDDQVRLLPHGRLRLGEDSGAPMDDRPRLVLLSSYVSGGGLGKGEPQLAGVRASGSWRCLYSGGR